MQAYFVIVTTLRLISEWRSQPCLANWSPNHTFWQHKLAYRMLFWLWFLFSNSMRKLSRQHTIWFQPWAFQQRSHIPVSLSFLRLLSSHAGRRGSQGHCQLKYSRQLMTSDIIDNIKDYCDIKFITKSQRQLITSATIDDIRYNW